MAVHLSNCSNSYVTSLLIVFGLFESKRSLLPQGHHISHCDASAVATAAATATDTATATSAAAATDAVAAAATAAAAAAAFVAVVTVAQGIYTHKHMSLQ